MTRPLASYLAPYIADGGPLPSTVTVNAADLLAAVGELRRMRELCQRAFYEMLNLGNDLNWPHEIPMSYGEIMNELKAAALAPADGQYLCERCGHAESDHPVRGCAAFARR
jgi:hypothetical protein